MFMIDAPAAKIQVIDYRRRTYRTSKFPYGMQFRVRRTLGIYNPTLSSTLTETYATEIKKQCHELLPKGSFRTVFNFSNNRTAFYIHFTDPETMMLFRLGVVL